MKIFDPTYRIYPHVGEYFCGNPPADPITCSRSIGVPGSERMLNYIINFIN